MQLRLTACSYKYNPTCAAQGNCSVIRAPVKKQWLYEGQIDRNDEYRDEDDEPVPSHIQSLLHEAKSISSAAKTHAKHASSVTKSAASAARRSIHIEGATAAVASTEANAVSMLHKGSSFLDRSGLVPGSSPNASPAQRSDPIKLVPENFEAESIV